MASRAEQRMIWLLNYMRDKTRGFQAAWDEELMEEFLKAFPEANKTLKVYTIGPMSCPMLDRAARRAHKEGYLRKGSLGNQDAKYYCQRTWCRTWRIVMEGWDR